MYFKTLLNLALLLLKWLFQKTKYRSDKAKRESLRQMELRPIDRSVLQNLQRAFQAKWSRVLKKRKESASDGSETEGNLSYYSLRVDDDRLFQTDGYRRD